jgi:endonuclease V-like protein UPF0215 family
VHISQVKEYFRSIGVAAHQENGKHLIVGVVYRGKNVIDGVISRETSSGLVEGIADMLCDSKHRGQVRLILLDEELLPEQVSAEYLWEQTEKPVLIFTNREEIDPRYFFSYKERVIQAAGIDEESAKRVLDKVTSESGAESLRIADIILRNIARLHNV